MSIRLNHSLILLLTMICISACSNNKTNTAKQGTVNPATSKPGVVKHRVEVKPPSKEEKQLYAALLEEKNKKELVETPVLKRLKPPILKRVKPDSIHPIKKTVTKRVNQRPKVNKTKVVKRRSPSTYITPPLKAPVNNIKYASLSGDYANNEQTKQFINKMESKHGFDRGYLNYLLSNTNETPFLKKMAYRDAYGSRKSSKKRKQNPGRWNRYRDNFLTERTINKGVEFWENNRTALLRAEQKYGVPKEYILGIIGVETRYGGNVGQNRAINALSAMGFNNPRRGKYFRSELEAYLLMTRKEGLDPLKPMASFAGALGLSQFMPSNIKRYAVDHDNSGSVNLWTPHDAIGSVANYFKKHGWQTGGTVAVPANSKNNHYKALQTGFKSKHSLANLNNNGVSADRLGNISDKVSLIKLNTYNGDELWLGGHNFYVITRYNHSTHYAMAVHQLAKEIHQRIGGQSPIRQASINTLIKRLKL